MRQVVRGGAHGFGFAIGLVAGFMVVSYVVGKAIDLKAGQLVTGLEAWVAEQQQRLNTEE